MKAEETAWRIHTALQDWTASVDAKASFSLAIESATLAGVVALSQDDRILAQRTELPDHMLFWSGVGFMAVAVISVLLVVRPRLRARKLKGEYRRNFIYFGHLRYWDSNTLTAALRDHDSLPMLAQQLVVMGRVAWQKHRYVQVSITCATVGVMLLFLEASFIEK